MTTRRQWLLLLLLTLAAYGNSLTGEFVFDNRAIIGEDPRLDAPTLENLRLVFTREYWWPREGQPLYRPLTTFTYWLQAAVLGQRGQPFWFHLVNLLLHLINVALVWRLTVLALPAQAWAPFLAGAVFAVHPITTEAVTNIVGRADQLATCFVLLGLWAHVGRKPALTSLAWLGGLLSKENAVVLPALMLLWDWIVQPTNTPARRRWLIAYGALAPAGASWWILRSVALAHSETLPLTYLDNSLLLGNAITARLTAITILGRYLWLLLWPQTLSADYSFRQIPLVTSWLDLTLWWSLTVLLGLTVIALGCRHRAPLVTWGIAAFFVAQVPTSNLIFFCGSTMAERFLYLPLAAAVLAVAAGVNAPRRAFTPSIIAIITAVLLAWTARTALRNRDWQNDGIFWRTLVRTSPSSFRAWTGLARQYLSNENNPQMALKAVERALTLAPDALPVLILAGEVYREAGNPGKAEIILERAATIASELTDANRRYVAARGGRPDRVRDFPSAAVAKELGRTRMQMARPDAAVEAFVLVRQIKPTEPEAYAELAEALQAAGQPHEAIRVYWQHTFIAADAAASYRALVELYRVGSPPDCAVEPVSGGWRIRQDCPRVRADICAAYWELAELLERAGHVQEAHQAHMRAQTLFRCDEVIERPAPAVGS